MPVITMLSSEEGKGDGGDIEFRNHNSNNNWGNYSDNNNNNINIMSDHSLNPNLEEIIIVDRSTADGDSAMKSPLGSFNNTDDFDYHHSSRSRRLMNTLLTILLSRQWIICFFLAWFSIVLTISWVAHEEITSQAMASNNANNNNDNIDNNNHSSVFTVSDFGLINDTDYSSNNSGNDIEEIENVMGDAVVFDNNGDNFDNNNDNGNDNGSDAAGTVNENQSDNDNASVNANGNVNDSSNNDQSDSSANDNSANDNDNNSNSNSNNHNKVPHHYNFEQSSPPYNLNCIDDRLPNGHRLNKGEFICSKRNLFAMGLNEDDGNLIWMDLNASETKTYYDRSVSNNAADSASSAATTKSKEGREFFTLTKNGNFVVINKGQNNDEDTTHWEKRHNRVKFGEIDFTANCLPNYDCPYIHIHGEGVIVLNWVDPITGAWEEHNIDKVYNFDFGK